VYEIKCFLFVGGTSVGAEAAWAGARPDPPAGSAPSPPQERGGGAPAHPHQPPVPDRPGSRRESGYKPLYQGTVPYNVWLVIRIWILDPVSFGPAGALITGWQRYFRNTFKASLSH
jgi:hypothetical protein